MTQQVLEYKYMDTSTFAQKIKAKYPAYQNVDDATLVNKFLEKYPVYKSQIQQEPTMGQNIVSDIKERGQNISDINTMRRQGQSVVGEVLQTVAPKLSERLAPLLQRGQQVKQFVSNPSADVATQGQLAGGINDVIGEAIGAIIPEKWKQFGEEKVKQLLGTAGIDTIEKYNEWATKNPLTAKNIEGAVNIAGLLPTGKAGEVVGTAAVDTLKSGGTKLVGAVDDIAGGGMKLAGDSKTKLMEFIAPEIDKKVAVVLEKTPTSKFNEMENIAKLASENFDNPSAFEVVSNKIADSAEQINGQVKSLSQQKKGIISKAKNGSTDFTKETGETILDINRSLKDSTTGKLFIQKLKGVKTKIDADNVIDEMQDILYKGNKDMTIPVGSQEDRILKGIIGKYNGKLKDGLPSSYANINTKISERLSSLDDLNKALGETIEGVPVRGASLVKQYFSPSGTKARQLFDFIKKTTGYNPAEDAVLAKYMSEVYGDTRTKSLLQGIPTSTTGAVEKIIDFAVEKTGLGGALQESVKQGGITKARKLTSPAK